ncbi:MAG TPA: 3-methyl-2-oxobutanoate hydroxymethyltransferase [Syntrophomonas sp.]|nr:3-methyl-2-oxobutanoate hydroxymethyltransferase [Syntrophomonas sp.]
MSSNEEMNKMYSPLPKMSLASRGRKSISYLQKMKDEGKLIVQMCPAGRDPYWTMAAEMAGCDICRLPSSGGTGGPEMSIEHAPFTLRSVRQVAPNIHINFVMETPTFASKEDALRYGSIYMATGADSLLPMGVNNETLKYMADNHLVVFGHVGALSGWQTLKWGTYRRLGKTAEDAMRIFRQAYEYQENGMLAMSIELTPFEVTRAIAKKLRVPVIAIAASGGADGYEMVDMDTFGMMASPATHAKTYANFFKWASDAYGAWANDVRTAAYPEDKHGFHMDEAELDKFMNTLEQKY